MYKSSSSCSSKECIFIPLPFALQRGVGVWKKSSLSSCIPFPSSLFFFFFSSSSVKINIQPVLLVVAWRVLDAVAASLNASCTTFIHCFFPSSSLSFSLLVFSHTHTHTREEQRKEGNERGEKQPRKKKNQPLFPWRKYRVSLAKRMQTRTRKKLFHSFPLLCFHFSFFPYWSFSAVVHLSQTFSLSASLIVMRDYVAVVTPRRRRKNRRKMVMKV